ncbi:ribokinase [Arthrobacter sp. SRS-W-1-2016]|jgi:1-phosphofructokinase family hexose kinase|uniref:1-phosphofructokinase family hexose kinase n=1 Tax=Arthrobacter TaxID=1663 RepID=UPI000990E36C|nr:MULTISPECIES: hexose kinase [Arthrobacter]MDQ0210137.1 1-phosphofructokinase family hexose kinase [Arthrobacter bambusae]MDQ0234923.1 1-phosphofructokinase family hexose kinase [Arthrobacter bambusae]OOP64360.1 ribokinase [Arthrobacter sp. SRS-W-1-2016]
MNGAIKRVITVTPNPAIDLSYHVAGITPGASHRVAAPLSRAGGKGLNVARVAHQLGHPVLALAPSGGAAGAEFAAELRSSGVPHRLIPVASDTRRSIALVDTVGGETSIFNEEGCSLQPSEWQALAAAVVDALHFDNPDGQSAGVLVGSGSLPPGAPADFYPALVRLAHDAGIPAVVDTSGPGIVAAARAGADLLKPNNHELLEATGESSLDVAARRLIALGAKTVLVSAGAEGMLAFHDGAPGGYWSARLPEPLSGNPTGAGDAGVAAAAVALADGITDIPTILRRATAWSAAAVLMPAAGEISPLYADLEDQLILSWKETR